MKKRNIIAVICFSIITLGVYDLFWLVSTKKELNAKTKEHVPSVWMLFAPILVLIVLAIVEGVMTAAQASSGSSGSATTLIFTILIALVAIVATIVVPVVWFLKYSKAVHDYTNGELSTAVCFLLLWMLRFIGIAVIQDKFNDMIVAGGGMPGMMPMNGMAGAAPMTPQMPVTPTPMPGATPADPSMGMVTPAPQPTAAPMPPTQMPGQPVVQPQMPVDPTNSESYGQQPQTPPAPQPPTPSAGPLVQ